MLASAVLGISGGHYANGDPYFEPRRGPEPMPPTPPLRPRDDEERMAAAEEKRQRKAALKQANALKSAAGQRKPMTPAQVEAHI